jgi:uncharacterized protein with PIN domain
MARLYSNENFPLPVVRALRALGHDVQTTRDAGKDGLAVPDEEVLVHAAREGRILLTLNRQDFKKLHRQNPAHAGIVLCTVDADFPSQAKRIDAALQANPAPTGLLLRVNRPHAA